MKTQHTKGPWVKASRGLIQVKNGIGSQVAIVYPPHVGNAPKTVEEQEANTHLMAAAPDLLEALESAIPLLVKLGDFIGNGEKTSDQSLGIRCDTILAAKNALRKAYGHV